MRAGCPRCFESPEICARISETAAELTGLQAGTPVAAGAGDQGAGAVGMGILQPGIGFGDDRHFGSGVCRNCQADQRPEGTAAHVLPRGAGVWHVMGVTQSAG
jgi:xylulokinase